MLDDIETNNYKLHKLHTSSFYHFSFFLSPFFLPFFFLLSVFRVASVFLSVFLTFSSFFNFFSLLYFYHPPFSSSNSCICPPPLNSLNTPSNDLYSPQVESTSQNDQWPLKEEFTNAFDIFRGSGWRMRVSPVRRARTVSAHPTSKQTGLYTTGIIFNNIFFYNFIMKRFIKNYINKQNIFKFVLPILLTFSSEYLLKNIFWHMLLDICKDY